MPERIDRIGEFKTALKKNKKIILATQDICALCGAPVDKTLRAPDPMSPNVDHIIPIAKGGHPSSLDNLQLTHRWCNLHKGDKLFTTGPAKNRGVKNNPTHLKDRGTANNPTPLKNRGAANNPPTSDRAAFDRTEINNDDLPLHADWSSLVW